jgi:hypothetical protein
MQGGSGNLKLYIGISLLQYNIINFLTILLPLYVRSNLRRGSWAGPVGATRHIMPLPAHHHPPFSLSFNVVEASEQLK